MINNVEPVVPRPSASLVIARNIAVETKQPGMEIFVAVRNRATTFASGALVFPGGALESGDGDGAVEGLAALRITAIRETFEETGILFAQTVDGAWPDTERLAAVRKHRDAVARDESLFSRLLPQYGLRTVPDALTYFAHWVTPAERSKRFSTRFFIAQAPPGQDGVHDGSELVESFWRSPQQIVEYATNGEYFVMVPTEMNCRRLSSYACVEEAIADFENHPAGLVSQRYVTENGRRYLSIPARAGIGDIRRVARSSVDE